METNPFDLSDATIKDEAHVRVVRQAPHDGLPATYWKIFRLQGIDHAAYWTERENKLIAGLWAKDVKRVVRLHAMQTGPGERGGTPVTQQIATLDAGLTLDQWLRIRPCHADGSIHKHPFQTLAALLALASASLDALHHLHRRGYVHLDLRSDNICLPYTPYPFAPAAGGQVTPHFAKLALIDFAFSISHDNPLQHPLPILPTGKGQSERLRQALRQDIEGNGQPPFHADRLDWRCDVVSLGHLLHDLLQRGDVLAPWPAGQDALPGLIRLIDELKAYDHGPDAAELPHQGWIEQIAQWQRGLATDEAAFRFALASTAQAAPSPASVRPKPDEPTPVLGKPAAPTPVPGKNQTPVKAKPPTTGRWRAASAGVLLIALFAVLFWRLSLTKLKLDSTTPSPAATLPRDLGKACPECPEMVELPQGRFTMGSPHNEAGHASDEGPQHSVSIGYRLAVGKYEVTRAEFARFAQAQNHTATGGCYVWTGTEWKSDASKSWRDPGFKQSDADPVACVSWDDAQAYLRWLNDQAGLSGANRYRLLSEAEWEYAARAGTEMAYGWGGNADDACGYANGADQTAKQKFPNWTGFNCADGYVYTAPVGHFKPNAFDLHDMHGNVWEWTQDCYHDSYKGAPEDGSAWGDGTNCANSRRVLRGGSWSNNPQDLRSAGRGRGDADVRSDSIGFRLARTLTP